MLKIGMQELEKARKLQEESVKLHLPSPPVASYKISRMKNNGEIEHLIHAKSNSYVRNAYNILTHALTFASATAATHFGDGSLRLGSSDGGISPFPGLSGSPLNYNVVLGTDGTPDTLDDIKVTEIPSGDWTGTLSRFSAFDSSSRRFITSLTRAMYNRSNNTYELKESGIYFISGASFLMVRDTFPSVTFAPGDNIIFTYQLEVYYPPVS